MLLLAESIAGHLLAAAPMWRIVLVSGMLTKAAAGWSWGLGIKNLSFVMCVAQPSSHSDLADEDEHVERAGLGHAHHEREVLDVQAPHRDNL